MPDQMTVPKGYEKTPADPGVFLFLSNAFIGPIPRSMTTGSGPC